MKIERILLAGALLLGTLTISAQDVAPAKQGVVTPPPNERTAAATTAPGSVTSALGLSAEQAAKLDALMAEANKQAMPMREQCAKIQTKVEAIYGSAYDQFAAALTPDQQAKLAEMRKSGQLTPSCGAGAKACAADAKPAGCSAGATGATGAPAGGCCAGKAQTGAPAPAPVKH